MINNDIINANSTPHRLQP